MHTNEPTNRTNNNGVRLALNSLGKAANALRLQEDNHLKLGRLGIREHLLQASTGHLC